MTAKDHPAYRPELTSQALVAAKLATYVATVNAKKGR